VDDSSLIVRTAPRFEIGMIIYEFNHRSLKNPTRDDKAERISPPVIPRTEPGAWMESGRISSFP